MSDDAQQTGTPSTDAKSKNRRSKEFHFLFEDLPAGIKALARKAFKMFLENPSHPALRHHRLKDSKKGRHQDGSFSVSINAQYRAIYVVVNDNNIWYWIGTHAAYNHYTGKN